MKKPVRCEMGCGLVIPKDELKGWGRGGNHNPKKFVQCEM